MRTSSGKRLWKWASTLPIFPEGCIAAMLPISLCATVYIYRDLTFVELSWAGEYISNEGNILSHISYAYVFFTPGSICNPGQEQKVTSIGCLFQQEDCLDQGFWKPLDTGFHDSPGETSLRYSKWEPKNQSFSDTPSLSFFSWFVLRLWGDL